LTSFSESTYPSDQKNCKIFGVIKFWKTLQGRNLQPPFKGEISNFDQICRV